MLRVNKQIGKYELLSMLGEGGMGQVFLARDPRLNRQVAIKVLRADTLSSPDGRARFAAEARAASALNHPNIITVYDVGEEESEPYLVSEYVEGETLRAIVRKGPVSARRLLDIGVQIAAGLAAAHGCGITHRDLKPENVIVKSDGHVKLVDFGLAKLRDTSSTVRRSLGNDDATLTELSLTDPGTVMGTAAYMSPEQAQGEVVDYRSDQFSFGLILFELASGKEAFRRNSRAETMAAIIREEPPPLESTVPAPLRWIVERLLAKAPQDRYASTEDLYRELQTVQKHLFEVSTANRSLQAAPTTHSWFRFAILAITAVSAIALTFALFSPLFDIHQFRYTPITREAAPEVFPSWSPDGRSIAYMAQIRGIWQIMVKEVVATSPAQVTHGASSAVAHFWSPDGAKIFFHRERNLWSVNASGGEESLAIPDAVVAAIHPDGKTFVFTRQSKLWTGTLDPNTQRQWTSSSLPATTRFVSNITAFSPDGSKIGLIMSAAEDGKQDLLLVSWPSAKARRVPLPPDDISSATWYPDSRRLLLSTRDQNENFRLQELDVLTGALKTLEVTPQVLYGQSIAPDGKRLAISRGSVEWDIYEMSVAEGRVRPFLVRGGMNHVPDWSPSGTHFLFSTRYRGYDELEDRAYPDGFSRVVVSTRTDARYAPDSSLRSRWAPDGNRIIITWTERLAQEHRVGLMNAAGGPPVSLDHAEEINLPGWSPDGQWIAYVRKEGPKTELVKIRPDAGAVPIRLAESVPGFPQVSRTDWSPKGDWILFVGIKAGLTLSSPDGKFQRSLSTRTPLVYGFSKDGARVYALIHNVAASLPEWQLLAFDVANGAESILATIDLPSSVAYIRDFSMHPDGKRFLFSAGQFNYDIWMLEGFDQHKSFLDRLLRR